MEKKDSHNHNRILENCCRVMRNLKLHFASFCPEYKDRLVESKEWNYVAEEFCYTKDMLNNPPVEGNLF